MHKLTREKKEEKNKEKSYPLKCQLEDDKICDNCCDCFMCDLEPGKICDNCAKCLDIADYNTIIIEDILLLEEKPSKKQKKKK